MLVSIKNLKKYVPLEGISAEEIANKLTFAGIEVEEIASLASGTHLIIGEIKECVSHPDSDHLHVLQVDLGKKHGVTQIVCGAPNARSGLKVIVARVGAKLPQIEIKAANIRGVSSNGMCCSLLELGVDSKYLNDNQIKGIEELPDDAPVGNENVLEYLGLDDVILNIKVLANRPDLLSLFNVAREVGALFSLPVSLPSVEYYDDFTTNIKIHSETKLCTQFAIKEVRNIVTKESPNWLKESLMGMGIRSINNVVDIGNYVMLMTGQPLHMYDLDKLEKKELIVRSDYEGAFLALDEKTYEIINNDIVICSNKKPKCLGGIMGGFDCAVDENTTNIVIESASFNGAAIRHTSNRLGLASESSSRFVKGTNHFQAEYVLSFACGLLQELCEAKKCSNTVEYQSEGNSDIKIVSEVKHINDRLGTNFSTKDIKEVLERLNFQIMMNTTGYFIAVVPPYRLDVTSEADLSEEVIRLIGIDKISSILPRLDTKVGVLTLKQQRLRQVRHYLLDRGLDECLTYSLLSKKEMHSFNLLNNEEHYRIINPITDEREYFRTHVLHSLLKVCTFNVARQNKDLALFETSQVQSKKTLCHHLAICLLGNELRRGTLEKTPFDFYHMKGLIEGLMTLLGIDGSRYKIEKLDSHLDELHPGKSAKLLFQGQIVGIFGELHPQKVDEYDLGKNNVVVLELNLDLLLNAKVNNIKMMQLSKFPSIERDLAFIVDKGVLAKDIVHTIKMAGKGLVKDVQLFDVYSGKGIDENQKSMAFKITYRSDDHTLSDKEIVDVQDDIKFEITKSFKAILRG